MTPADPWGTHRLDLDAYLTRIGARDGSHAPDTRTLRALHRAHVLGIPFENLDVARGLGVDTDLEAVQDKLVRRRRGGYCYEHTVLFGAALERLGFRVRRLLCRIGNHLEDPRPRTHMALRVEIEGAAWLADVGFGGTLLEPLLWYDDTPAEQGGWRYRLTDRGGLRVLEQRGGQQWESLHTLTDDWVHPADVVEVNHFTSTHPSSPFVGSLVAMRREPGRRVRLHGRELTVETGRGGATSRTLTAREAVKSLRQTFDLLLDDAEQAAVSALLEQ